MAGGKIKARLQASTIPEVVVSMVIIIVVFGIAMMIYANVMRMSLSSKKIQAEAILQEMLLKANENGNSRPQSVTIANFRIEQEIKPVPGEPQLSEITFTAFDINNQQTAQVKGLVINTDHAN